LIFPNGVVLRQFNDLSIHFGEFYCRGELFDQENEDDEYVNESGGRLETEQFGSKRDHGRKNAEQQQKQAEEAP
jgi:hypothetical protein